MCARAGRAGPRAQRSTGDSQKLGLGAFLKEKIAKGSAMLLSVARLCISISPFLK